MGQLSLDLRAPVGGTSVDLGKAGRSDAQTDWTWPPAAAPESTWGEPFATEAWAPPSTVRRPWIRVGRWTLLYRRGG